MNPAKNLQTSLTALMIAAFMLAPLGSNESGLNAKKKSFNIHLQVVDEGNSKQKGNIDLTIPVSNKKEQQKNKDDQPRKNSDDQPKSRHHAEEEKHKNHVYHYHRIKTKKKHHTTILCACLKILLAVSYLSILLLGYMNICH